MVRKQLIGAAILGLATTLLGACTPDFYADQVLEEARSHQDSKRWERLEQHLGINQTNHTKTSVNGIQNYPLPDCHSLLPTNPADYPVYWRPVFIPDEGNNLTSVREKYCGNAYRVVNTGRGIKAILVSAYDESDAGIANKLQQQLERDYGQAWIGDVSVIKSDPRK